MTALKWVAFNFYDLFITCIMLYDFKLLVGKCTLKNVSFASLRAPPKWSKARRSRIAEWGSQNLEDTTSCLSADPLCAAASVHCLVCRDKFVLSGNISVLETSKQSRCIHLLILQSNLWGWISGLINQTLSSTVCFLKFLHRLTVECHLPLKIRSETGPALQWQSNVPGNVFLFFPFLSL